MSTRTTEAQLSKIISNLKHLIDTGHFHPCNHQKWLPYQILSSKTIKNVQIDPHTSKMIYLVISTYGCYLNSNQGQLRPTNQSLLKGGRRMCHFLNQRRNKDVNLHKQESEKKSNKNIAVGKSPPPPLPLKRFCY